MKVRFNKKHTGKSIVSAFKTVHSKQKTTVIPTEDIYTADKGLQDLVVTVLTEVNLYANFYLIIRAEDINLEEMYNEIKIRILFVDKDGYPGITSEVKLLSDKIHIELQKSTVVVLDNLTDNLSSYKKVPF